MIQPQELRISNYIIREDLFDKNKRIEKITELYKEKALCSGPISVFVDYKDLQPIPLTEEMLLKFGFERIKSDKYPHKFIINKDMRDEVEIENLNSQNCFVFSHGKKFSLIKIEYVHQLQNLYFALTGKKLPFKN